MEQNEADLEHGTEVGFSSLPEEKTLTEKVRTERRVQSQETGFAGKEWL